MDHVRNELCKNIQERTESLVREHEERIGKLEIKSEVNDTKIDNVCVKLDNLTKALWGLTASFIIGVIMLLINKI